MFQWFQAWLLFRNMKLCDDAVPLLTSPAEYSLTTLLSAFTSTKRCGKNVKAEYSLTTLLSAFTSTKRCGKNVKPEYSLTTLLSAFTLWPVHPITMEAKMPRSRLW